MKPKIVSVKQLQISELAPPSEKEFVFLEMHGRMGAPGVDKISESEQPQQIAVSPVRAEKKGLLGWLKGFFGR